MGGEEHEQVDDGGYMFLASAELYDPATGTCARPDSLNFKTQPESMNDTATLLASGKVLVAGEA